MAVEYELLQMMTEVITVKTAKTLNNYGEKTYSGSPTSYYAKIDRSPSMVRDQQGRTVNASATLIIDSTTIKAVDEITMPDGSTPQILTVSTFRDYLGALHHQEIQVV